MKTLVAILAALVLVPAASAAYPTPFALQGLKPGLLGLDQSIRYVALADGANTSIVALRTADGARVAAHVIRGAYGIPMITYNGLAGGLFHDGSAFVVQSVKPGAPTSFKVLGTNDLAVRQTVALKGYFGFDALSPDGSKLYLIQHTSYDDFQHYVVREYDLARRTLLPNKIADKSQRGWVMQGEAVARTTSDDGRWVYTLYENPGGYPFVHALDTVAGVAHCVGFGWAQANQDALQGFTLALQGARLQVRDADGNVYRTIDTGTWRVSRP